MKKYDMEIVDDLPKKSGRKWEKLILGVLKKLPDEVGESLCKDTCISLIYTEKGSFIKKGKKIIEINIPEIRRKKVSRRERELIICHEMAHAFLNTYSEFRANNQMEKWGFIPIED